MKAHANKEQQQLNMIIDALDDQRIIQEKMLKIMTELAKHLGV